MRTVTIFALIAISYVASHNLREDFLYNEFQHFIQTYNKRYTNEKEFLARFEIFKENYAEIESFNAQNDSTYEKGVNQFSDMTDLEFQRQYLTLDLPLLEQIKSNSKSAKIDHSIQCEKYFDWRDKGAVAAVKNQGQCGSCWAFSAVANLEGLNFNKTGKLTTLSEQQLVDCDHNKDQGCRGGLMGNAFGYIQQAGGIEGDADYKYTAVGASCKFDRSKVVAKVSGYEMIDSQSVEDILKYLVSHGPISIAMNASDSLRSYKKGIINLNASQCSPKALDHGIAIVGYGQEDDTPYYIVRNSWGSTWGEDGYFRIAAVDGPGVCGTNVYVISAILG